MRESFSFFLYEWNYHEITKCSMNFLNIQRILILVVLSFLIYYAKIFCGTFKMWECFNKIQCVQLIVPALFSPLSLFISSCYKKLAKTCIINSTHEYAIQQLFSLLQHKEKKKNEIKRRQKCVEKAFASQHFPFRFERVLGKISKHKNQHDTTQVINHKHLMLIVVAIRECVYSECLSRKSRKKWVIYVYYFPHDFHFAF